MTFQELNLSNPLRNAIDDLGFTTTTLIQERSFPIIMSGKDVIGIAQTGTGKTFAFLLPSLNQWKFSKEKNPQILIVVPTRELVAQIVTEIEKLTEYMNVVTVGVYGGTNIRTQKATLHQGLDVLVATPGRLLDHIYDKSFNPKAIKHLVIDEVDEMLDLGFRPQLTRILDLLPQKRQNLMFSATMTTEVEKLLMDFFNSPVKVEAAPTGTPLKNIDQTVYAIPNFNSKVNLVRLLLQNEAMEKVLVFISTKKQADLLFELLDPEFPEQIGVIHSNKSQNFRFNVVNNFHSGDLRIVIATDIVARGIDVSEVSHVINFDIPEVAENYMHRIGRTGRADKKGNAISLCTEKELDFKLAIEKLMNHKIEALALPENLELSTELIEDEMPKIYMPNVEKKNPVRRDAGPAFHEKKAKNKKVNNKVRYVDKMKKKYKKPMTKHGKPKKKK